MVGRSTNGSKPLIMNEIPKLRFARRTYSNASVPATAMREEILWCQNHHHFSARLAAMCYKLVDGFGKQTHWKHYKYINEMQEHAMSTIKLRMTDFKSERSDNRFNDPYRYFVEVTNFAFREYLKKHTKIGNP